MRRVKLKRPVINGKQTSKWYVVWSEDGRSHRVSTRETDEVAAQRWMAEYLAALDAPPIEFDINMMITEYLKEAPGEVHHLKAVQRLVGNLSPNSLTRSQVRMFHRARRSEGVSESTINRQCRALRAVLSWGVKEGWIGSAPHVDAPQPNDARQRYLDYDEVMRFIDAAKSQHLRTFLALGVWTGARMSAILQLQWENVDPDRLLIYWPPGTWNKRRPHVTTINEPLALMLGTTALSRDDSGYVVSWRGRSIKQIKKAFYAAAEIAEISDVTIHDLRRTAASWLLMAGGTFEDAAALLEDDIRTVQKHYARFNENYLRNITNRIAGQNAHNAHNRRNR